MSWVDPFDPVQWTEFPFGAGQPGNNGLDKQLGDMPLGTPIAM